jgi:hypothetical protein
MFEILIWASIGVVALGMAYAYAGSRDVFHPLMFIGPMMLFMYAWMPLKLSASGGLDGFFDRDQLVFVQSINFAGILCFVLGSISIGCRLPEVRLAEPMSSKAIHVLVIAGVMVGTIGVAAWTLAIVNVGGLSDAFSTAYSGGWDDNGYVRDAALMMYPGFLLIIAAAVGAGFRPVLAILALGFLAPWMIQAALTSRRGPTFMIVVTLAMGWYMHRQKRPSLVAAGAAGMLLGFLLLFLVTNRQHIFIGSDQELTADVSDIVEKPDSGNEFIYGAGSILSAEQRNYFYWGRRYLAQIVVRPVPHTMWPTKYEDFGLPEMTHNAGTGEGFAETLGWEGAVGSAPGLIADLWLEFRWLNLPVLFLLGQIYARVWRKTHLQGGPWIAQYTIMAALSIYFVMQTMEAVIFRLLELSIPIWLVWRLAGYKKTTLTMVPAVAPEAEDLVAA